MARSVVDDILPASNPPDWSDLPRSGDAPASSPPSLEANRRYGSPGRRRPDSKPDPSSSTDPLGSNVPRRGSPSGAYRVIVADDHTIVRYGLRSLLEPQPDIEVCGEAVTGPEAIEETKRLKPDLLILDLSLPEKNGLEVLEEVRKDSPETQVLVLTMHFSEEVAREALRLGAIGYVLKSDANTELLAAVDNARHQQPFFTGRLAATMAQNFIVGQAEEPADAKGVPLTQRELDVVRLLALGKSNKQVALELKVSTRTVESHRHHIMKKMGFESFSDLIRFAVRNNLVEL